jgi:DNA polymerase-3 subunit chi
MAISHHDRAHALARDLRKAQTLSERAMWRLLRARQLEGLRFRRQVPLGPYVADFCCHGLKLVIELDGGVHRLREERDAARDAWLGEQGFEVLRFPNEAAGRNPNVVLDAVRAVARRKGWETPPIRPADAGHLPPQGGKDMKKPEIWFYHLERSSLEQVLPTLLEKTLERGWRALVKASAEHRLDDVDEKLWTYREDSFLPHGRAGKPHAERQPVLLSETGENLNGAQALFILDDAELGATEGFERCFIIFDGRDEPALQQARSRWKALKDQGADLAYWRQTDEGRWERAA